MALKFSIGEEVIFRYHGMIKDGIIESYQGFGRYNIRYGVMNPKFKSVPTRHIVSMGTKKKKPYTDGLDNWI